MIDDENGPGASREQNMAIWGSSNLLHYINNKYYLLYISNNKYYGIIVNKNISNNDNNNVNDVVLCRRMQRRVDSIAPNPYVTMITNIYQPYYVGQQSVDG